MRGTSVSVSSKTSSSGSERPRKPSLGRTRIVRREERSRSAPRAPSLGKLATLDGRCGSCARANPRPFTGLPGSEWRCRATVLLEGAMMNLRGEETDFYRLSTARWCLQGSEALESRRRSRCGADCSSRRTDRRELPVAIHTDARHRGGERGRNQLHVHISTNGSFRSPVGVRVGRSWRDAWDPGRPSAGANG